MNTDATQPTGSPIPASATTELPTTTPSGTDSGLAAETLSWTHTMAVIGIIAAAVLVAGGVVLLARRMTPDRQVHGIGVSIVRSWLAITLVIGLLMFCGIAFAIYDPGLRSTLIGALTASVGSVTTFYFASKASDQARQDILNAALGTEAVPDLYGASEAAAAATMGKTSLKLVNDPQALPTADAPRVKDQKPPKETEVPKGSTVIVSFGP